MRPRVCAECSSDLGTPRHRSDPSEMRNHRHESARTLHSVHTPTVNALWISEERTEGRTGPILARSPGARHRSLVSALPGLPGIADVQFRPWVCPGFPCALRALGFGSGKSVLSRMPLSTCVGRTDDLAISDHGGCISMIEG